MRLRSLSRFAATVVTCLSLLQSVLTVRRWQPRLVYVVCAYGEG